MKKALFILFITSAVFGGCSNQDDDPKPSSTGSLTSENVSKMIAGSTWKVDYYFDNGKDETSDYNGYTFQFKSNYELVAQISGTTYTGTWGIIENGDDDPSPHQRFNIVITGTKELDDLTDDWVPEDMSNTLIKLVDDNLADPEHLRFIPVQ